jgi:hypothetical protein
MMNTTLKVMKGAIGVAGLLGSLGVPFVPDAEGTDGIIEAMEGFVGGCSEESTVEDYTLFEKYLSREKGDKDAPPGKVHGGPLRELAKFLSEYDRDSTFCGMSRVVCSQTGSALWTLERERLEKGDESIVGSLTANAVSRGEFDAVVAEKDKQEAEIKHLRDELSRLRPRSPRREKDILEAREREKFLLCMAELKSVVISTISRFET